jgi:dTDP-4-amino-4,6-dideoxygalactose transaminase
VLAFEREFAAFHGGGYAIGTGTGTDALQLALRACGVGPGDAVLTVSHTAVATVAAIELTGASPVFVDIDPHTFTMAPERLAETLRRLAGGGGGMAGRGRVKAVIPVHLYGHPAPMPAILEIARQHGVRIVEDCAQAHGAEIGGQKAGTWGDMAAFSFYPTKNLGALGDGGAVVTRDAALAERAMMLREYGWRERYISEVPGMNSRLDPIQAAILRVRLRILVAGNERRRDIAARYAAAFSDGPLIRPPNEEHGCRHVYHQYVVRSPRRDDLRQALRTASVGTLIHYPLPVHLQPAYRDRIPVMPGELHATEHACAEILSLPMYPQMPADHSRRVIEAALCWARNAKR